MSAVKLLNISFYFKTWHAPRAGFLYYVGRRDDLVQRLNAFSTWQEAWHPFAEVTLSYGSASELSQADKFSHPNELSTGQCLRFNPKIAATNFHIVTLSSCLKHDRGSVFSQVPARPCLTKWRQANIINGSLLLSNTSITLQRTLICQGWLIAPERLAL